jgi:hypothetical protein
MMRSLPGLVLLSDYDNNWEKYLTAIYDLYLRQIVHSEISYKSLPVRCRYHPPTDVKGYGFWHLIQEGENEENRVPDLRRCELIQWVAWVIEEAPNNPDIRVYQNHRGSQLHEVLWFHSHKYAVILAQRNGYYLLKSAYPIKPHRERSFEKEWKAYNKG